MPRFIVRVLAQRVRLDNWSGAGDPSRRRQKNRCLLFRACYVTPSLAALRSRAFNANEFFLGSHNQIVANQDGAGHDGRIKCLHTDGFEIG